MTGIRFNVPFRSTNEDTYVSKVIKSCDFSSNSRFHQKATSVLNKIYHPNKVLLTSSCTHALEMAALAMDIREGDEVIIPSFTFMSTANAFVLRGAKIIFAPIVPETMNIDLTLVESLITAKTKALVIMHYAGIGCDMDLCMNICGKYDLTLVEDAAHCIGATWNGKPLGTFGDYGTLSFHHTKNIHCTEGGALILKNEEAHQRCQSILEKGTNRGDFEKGLVDRYNWVRLGSSYALGALNAAFLQGQLEELEDVNQKRVELWKEYYQLLNPLKSHISLPHVPEEAEHNGHIFYIKCKNKKDRNHLIDLLKNNEVHSYFHYPALHDSPAGRKYGIMPFKGVEACEESDRLLRLPIYPELSTAALHKICDLILKYYHS